MTVLERLRAELSCWPTDWSPTIGDDGEWTGWRGVTPRSVERGDDSHIENDHSSDYAIALGAFVADLVNTAPALLDLAEAVQRWRDAKIAVSLAYNDKTRGEARDLVAVCLGEVVAASKALK